MVKNKNKNKTNMAESQMRSWSNSSIFSADTTREELEAVDPRNTVTFADPEGIGVGPWNWQLQSPSADRYLAAKEDLASQPGAGLNVLTDRQIELQAEQMAKTEELARDNFIVDRVWGIPGVNPIDFAPELYQKRMSVIDNLMDKQWQLAQIKLQGNVGYTPDEWNLLYDVENKNVQLPEVGAHLVVTQEMQNKSQ